MRGRPLPKPTAGIEALDPVSRAVTSIKMPVRLSAGEAAGRPAVLYAEVDDRQDEPRQFMGNGSLRAHSSASADSRDWKSSGAALTAFQSSNPATQRRGL